MVLAMKLVIAQCWELRQRVEVMFCFFHMNWNVFLILAGSGSWFMPVFISTQLQSGPKARAGSNEFRECRYYSQPANQFTFPHNETPIPLIPTLIRREDPFSGVRISGCGHFSASRLWIPSPTKFMTCNHKLREMNSKEAHETKKRRTVGFVNVTLSGDSSLIGLPLRTIIRRFRWLPAWRSELIIL
jgi:hypothetical protein